MLAPGDAELIAKYLGISTDQMTGRLLASPGALILDRATMVPRRIHTLVPDRRPDGTCIFLNEQENCIIHPVAPYGCAYFDDHMSALEGNRRSAAALVRIETDLVYQARWIGLWVTGRRAPAPEKLRRM
jgi:Fe-S-cluster containining protein